MAFVRERQGFGAFVCAEKGDSDSLSPFCFFVRFCKQIAQGGHQVRIFVSCLSTK
jgi:hypothetical protein